MRGNSRTFYGALMRPFLHAALEEDLGRAGDLTTDAIVSPDMGAKAAIVARQGGCVAGLDASLEVFRILDPDMSCGRMVADGERVAAGDLLAQLDGRARAILSAERVALNLLGHLSGIATAAGMMVERLQGLTTGIACTRKTTPGLRSLEKHAVRMGGGVNHRFGLDDAVLIKDNHLALAGSLREAVGRVRRNVGHLVKIEVEVDTLGQLEEVLELSVDAVLLDNMTVEELSAAVALVSGRMITEASGGITLENVRQVASTGVDLISLGWLTHSSPALDVGLDM